MLRLDRVSYRHAGVTQTSLDDVSIELRAGSVTGIVGPSNAGKSTLCLVAGGLAPRVTGGTLTGSVGLDGEDMGTWPMHRVAEHVVTGLQDPSGQLSLVADTVFEEVALGISHLGVARTEIIERTYEALDELGITELAGRDPEQLSAGQQQLVVIAGLVVMRPSFLVLDEPLAHLDARSSQRVLAALDAAAARGAGILVAEQRTPELLHACSELIVLDGGKVERQGPPRTLLADPAVIALGIDEPAELRLVRLARESGLTLPESLMADP